MVKKLIVLLGFAAISILLAVSVQAQTVHAEGRYMSNKLTHLAPFNSIEVRGDAQVDVWQRDVGSVSVSGKSNLIALADIRVENETLIIDYKRPAHLKGNHALHVAIATPDLKSVSANESGRVRVRGSFDIAQLSIMATDKAYVTADGIKTDLLRVQAANKAEVDLGRMQVKKLEVAVFDKAEVDLSGSAEQAQIINNSTKDIEADSLRIHQAHIRITGRGDVEAFIMQSLLAQAMGSGKIIYHGQPVVTREGASKRILPAFEN